jgi:enoyl-CoA hydratase/carnithine racemase
MSDDIHLELVGRRAELVLDRPDKRNAITRAMWDAIPNLVASVAEDARVRFLVIRGEGGSFAAGADIAEFPEVFASAVAATANQSAIAAAMEAVENFPKPTVALIHGACVGGGCGLALACDLRIAAENARLGITPAKLGLVYGVGDTRRLVQAVGLSRAKDILFTGRLIDAAEALRIGLVDRVAADPVAALDLLEAELVAASGASARAQKTVFRLLRNGARDDDPASMALFVRALEDEDFREGFAAFSEKRPPRFK